MSLPWARRYEPHHPAMRWIDARLPLPRMIYNALGGGYPVPRNLNYWWNFGFLAGLCLLIQIVTGVVMAMHYADNSTLAFASIEKTVRDVNWGWAFRALHANGASAFFAVLYIHIFRGFYYGSYKAPRELVWLLGVVIFLLTMATAFTGYVLPWGQMSFWGAKVITGLFSAIPLVGDSIQHWILGGYAPDNATLNRFFALHFLFTFVIVGVVILHIWALHIPGSSNPTGIEIKAESDTVPFHPFYVAKDGWVVGLFLIALSGLVFFAPDLLGHAGNYIPANPMSTPEHIVPEWYFWPFYAILRAFTADFLFLPAKLMGVLAMFSAILVWFFLPWLDTSPVRSGKYRPVFRWFFRVLVIDVLVLGWCGGRAAQEPYVMISQIAAIYYFAHFLIILPLVSLLERPDPLPFSITESVLGDAAPAHLRMPCTDAPDDERPVP